MKSPLIWEEGTDSGSLERRVRGGKNEKAKFNLLSSNLGRTWSATL